MDWLNYHETREPAGQAHRVASTPVPREIPDEAATEEDTCCCGKPESHPSRCGCTGDPESGADCCCKSA